jgi:hypothetical protein
MAIKLIIDALLIIGFGVQHSILAMIRVKSVVQRRRGWNALQWRGVESLSNILYVLTAASLWQSVDSEIWHVEGPARAAMWTLLAIGWLWYLQLHLFEYDPGLAFGSTPLINSIMGVRCPTIESWNVGTRRWIRFPVHTAFFLMFFMIPTMSASTFVLAVTANLYNIVGSVLYDRRMERLVGDPYRQYQRVTGLILPALRRAPAGARDIAMPAPVHWSRPSRNVGGLLFGFVGGAFYFLVLGATDHEPRQMVTAGVCGLAVALVGGALLGLVLAPLRPNREVLDAHDRYQTTLATNAGLLSGGSLVVWVVLTYLTQGRAPEFGPFLSMWFTVLCLGQLVAYAIATAVHPDRSPSVTPVRRATMARR